MFFTGLFEKLGIEPQIFRVGDYKSAVEPFMRKDLSEENKEQISAYVSSIYDHMLGEIA
jgi:protease-4